MLKEIIDMPEEYRNLDIDGEKVLSTIEDMGEYAIKSVSFPQLTKRILYLKGFSKARDEEITYYSYSTAEEAVKAKALFEEMIKRINEERRKK